MGERRRNLFLREKQVSARFLLLVIKHETFQEIMFRIAHWLSCLGSGL